MTTLTRLARPLGAAIAGLAIAMMAGGTGFAASSQELITAWIDALNESGKVEIKVGSIDSALLSGAVTLSDVTSVSTEKGGVTHSDTIVFEGVEEGDDGKPVVERITVSNLTATKDDTVVSVENFAVSDVVLKLPESEDEAPFGRPGGFSFTNLSISKGKDKPEIPIASGQMKFTDFVDDTPTRVAIGIDGLSMPTALIEDEKGRRQIESLGYTSLDISLDSEFHYSAEGSGEAVIDRFRLAMVDAGELSISGRIGGIPPTVLENPEKSGEQLLSTATINAATIRLDNDSLVERLLEQQAKAAGMSVEDFRKQVSAMLPAMLAALQAPEFEKEVAGAVSAFLADPQSLSIIAAPQAPVLIAQVVGLAMSAPNQIPAVLGLKVTAND